MFRRGERALFWLGPRKLLFLSAPPRHLDYVQRLGYTETAVCVPEHPSASICADILASPRLLAGIAAYAGAARTVALVPYVTTPALLELARVLRDEHGLTVLLPESPAPHNLWLRDYADRKSGFRLLAAETSGVLRLPRGMVCGGVAEATSVARWFGAQGKPCIAKPDAGNSGFGHVVIEPGAGPGLLEASPFLRDGGVVVEEFIPSSSFPSVEFLVPALGQGPVRLTYACEQIVEGQHFGGVVLTPEQRHSVWYLPLVNSGLAIGRRLQSMGYVGHFDLDAVVPHSGPPLLLELNARRTGGTHVHEFAMYSLGRDYAGEYALIAHAELPCPAAGSIEDLLERLNPFLYPMDSRRRGLVVTNTPVPDDRTFGCIIVGQDTADAHRLQELMLARI